jgi:hypothetical protein
MEFLIQLGRSGSGLNIRNDISVSKQVLAMLAQGHYVMRKERRS